MATQTFALALPGVPSTLRTHFLSLSSACPGETSSAPSLVWLSSSMATSGFGSFSGMSLDEGDGLVLSSSKGVVLFKTDASSTPVEALQHSMPLDAKIRGNTLAATFADKTVALVRRDRPGGKWGTKQLLEGKELGFCYCVEVGNEGKMVSVGSTDSRIRIWRDTGSGIFEITQVIVKHNGAVNSLCLSNDSNTLISSSDDGSIISWKISTTDNQFKLSTIINPQGPNPIFSTAINHNGTILISHSDTSVVVWTRKMNLAYHQEEILEGHKCEVARVAISQNGRYIASSSIDYKIIIWEKQSGSGYKKYDIIETHTDDINGLVFNLEGSLLFSCSADKTIGIARTRPDNSELTIRFKAHSKRIAFLVSSEDGAVVVSIDEYYEIKVWIRNREDKYDLLASLVEVHSNVTAIEISHNGSLVVVATEEPKIGVWGIKDNKIEFICVLGGVTSKAKELSITHDNRSVATLTSNNKFILWLEGKKGEYNVLQIVENLEDPLNSTCLSKDGKILAIGGKEIRIYSRSFDYKQFKPEYVLNLHSSLIKRLVFSPSGLHLASSSRSHPLVIWVRLRGNDQDRKFTFGQIVDSQSKVPSSIRFNELGTVLVTCSDDLKIRFFRKECTNLFSLYLKQVSQSPSTCYLLTANSNIKMVNKEIEVIRLRGFFSYFYIGHAKYLSVLVEIFNNNFSKKSVMKLEALIDEDKLDIDDFLDNLIIHVGINIILFAVLSRSTGAVTRCLEKYGYNEELYPDSMKWYDPFEVSINLQNLEIQKCWAEYINKNPNSISFESNSRIRLILSANNIDLRLSFQNLFLRDSIAKNIDFPKIGHFHDGQEFGYSQGTDFRIDTSDLESFKLKNAKSGSPVNILFLTTAIPIDCSLASDFTSMILEIMLNAESDFQMSRMRYLMRMIYTENRKWFWCYSTVNWIGIISLLLIVVWEHTEVYIVAPFVICYTANIIYETTVLVSSPSEYLSDMYNVVDGVQYPGGVLLGVYILLYGNSYLTSPTLNFITSIFIGMVILRSITMLRVMDGVRYMISMILEVFLDMRYFLTLVVLFIAGISVLKVIGGISDNTYEGTIYEYWSKFDLIYNWGFGNWDDPFDLTWNNYFLYVFSSIFLALVLWNMLIAIISMTFERFTEERHLVDVQQMIDMLNDMNKFMRCYKKWLVSSTPHYYHFMIEKHKVIDEIEELRIEIKEAINKVGQSVEEKASENKKYYDQELHELKKLISSENNRIQKALENLARVTEEGRVLLFK